MPNQLAVSGEQILSHFAKVDSGLARWMSHRTSSGVKVPC